MTAPEVSAEKSCSSGRCEAILLSTSESTIGNLGEGRNPTSQVECHALHLHLHRNQMTSEWSAAGYRRSLGALSSWEDILYGHVWYGVPVRGKRFDN